MVRKLLLLVAANWLWKKARERNNRPIQSRA